MKVLFEKKGPIAYVRSIAPSGSTPAISRPTGTFRRSGESSAQTCFASRDLYWRGERAFCAGQ